MKPRQFQTIGLILVLALVGHVASVRGDDLDIPEQVPVSPAMREVLRVIHATGAYDTPDLPLRQDET